MTLITAIGLAAAVCTTASYIPQAIKVIRTKHTKDLSLSMYVILNIGIILWLTYGFLLVDWPIILANIVTLIFSGTILGLKMRYK